MAARKGHLQSLDAEKVSLIAMANLGEELWKHPDDGRKASLRLVTLKYTTDCASKAKCATSIRQGLTTLPKHLWQLTLLIPTHITTRTSDTPLDEKSVASNSYLRFARDEQKAHRSGALARGELLKLWRQVQRLDRHG